MEEEEEEEILSYDYIDILTELVYAENVERCMVIVKEMFEKFPKENDCITGIILHGIFEECTKSKKYFVKFLISYLFVLKHN